MLDYIKYYNKSLPEYKDATMEPNFIKAMTRGEFKCLWMEDGDDFIALPTLVQERDYNKVLRSDFNYCNLLSNMNPIPGPWLDSIYDLFNEYMYKYKSLFLPINPYNSEGINYNRFMNTYYNRKIVYIDLTKTEQQIEEEIHKKHMHLIKKAIKNELRVSSDKKYFNDFLRLYTQTMDKHKANNSYYYSENNLRLILENNTLLTCLVDDKVIASSIFIHSQHNKVVHYFLSGNDTEYNHLSPNTFLLYKAIDHFRCQGYNLINLGGKHGDNELLYKYKSRFSNTLKDFYIGEFNNDTRRGF